MRLVAYNYVQETPTTVFSSSENPNFPALNVKHQIRGKEWRSNGNFVIEAGKNRICFDEGFGEIVASITPGTYSVSQLKAEIKTQLEAVGALTYTVTFNHRTGLWSISATGEFALLGATGSHLDEVLSIIGFAIADRAGEDNYTAPKIALHTEEHIGFDFKTAEEIDSVAIMWPKGNFNLSENATIRLQANATANFTAPAIDVEMNFSDKFEIATHYFAAPESYRYWRVVIVDPENNNLYVSVGVVIIGLNELTEAPGNGFTLVQSDRSTIVKTDFGHEYTDEYPVLRVLNLNFKLIEYPIVEKLIELYEKIGSKRPVFVTMGIDNSLFDKDCFAIYGKFPESITHTHYSFNIFDDGLSIREIA